MTMDAIGLAKRKLREHCVQNGINGSVGIGNGSRLVINVAYQHYLPADQFAAFEGFPVEWRVIGPAKAL